jgi:Na+/H+ antiporter NhaC
LKNVREIDYLFLCQQDNNILKTKFFTRAAIAIIIFVVLCFFASKLSLANGHNPLSIKWYGIIPPVLAISLAILTRHVLLSLGIAIIVGGLLTEVPQSPMNVMTWLVGIKSVFIFIADTVTNKTNLQVLTFIPLIFIMVEVVIASGGFKGIILWLLRLIRGRKSAQLVTALMGILCFIDDYTNAIVVGSMMQPITDKFRVSREKLAFLVDATSAPIAGLAVVSTWIDYEVSLLNAVGQELGIAKSGYSMFFDALSFRFYCLLMISFVFMHILWSRDFGPMKEAQERAITADQPEENGTAPFEDPDSSGIKSSSQKSGRAINALIPLAGLLLFHMTGLWIDGEGPSRLSEGGSLLSLVYWRDVIGNAGNSPLVLAFAGLFGLTLALLCARFFGGLKAPVMYRCFRKGIKRAAIPFVILILAWSLKRTCDSLQTGEFLTTILAGKVSPYWFPPILFLVASVTSFATGTSYGTMAILIPTAIPVAFALDGNSYGLTTMISLGAVLDGAIFGDHCSPISDTTIMSSIASSCDLIDHVRTQLPYSLFVGVLALLFAYLPSALGLASGWSFILAISVMVCFFIILTRYKKPR